jgi:cation transport protein ChaC
MALTEHLVELTKRHEPDHGPDARFTPVSKLQLDELAERLVRELGSDDLWLFAYGSLIWKPNFSFSQQFRAKAYGWQLVLHRIDQLARKPFLARVDAGSRARRAMRRSGLSPLRRDSSRANRKADTWEITTVEDISMVRWSTVWTSKGPVRALVFWAGPEGPGIFCKLPLPHIAWTLARACGHGGSGAEYLYHTVVQLEHLGIRDSFLWQLQQLVAAEILSLHPDAMN